MVNGRETSNDIQQYNREQGHTIQQRTRASEESYEQAVRSDRQKLTINTGWDAKHGRQVMLENQTIKSQRRQQDKRWEGTWTHLRVTKLWTKSAGTDTAKNNTFAHTKQTKHIIQTEHNGKRTAKKNHCLCCDEAKHRTSQKRTMVSELNYGKKAHRCVRTTELLSLKQ